MERALNRELIASALGRHARLPSPEALQQLLSNVEIGLFTRRGQVEAQLLAAAWYLQSVATAREELQLYETDRQRHAHQVSGHIFDLELQSNESLDELTTLQYTFAAQIAYIGGDLTPNATALARRIEISAHPEDLVEPGVLSLEAGVLLLALDRPRIYPWLDSRLGQLAVIGDESREVSDFAYAAAECVVRGVRDLIDFLTTGRGEVLSSARELFWQALGSEAAASDVDSRWVAAHLLRISNGLESSSVWSVLPNDLPGVGRAMTLGDPPVLQLWPPQMSFLTPAGQGETSPLDESARRIILSFPTSAGKSLLAQLFVTAHIVKGSGDVCVVAPTHSLCRELGESLQRRLRTLGHHLHVESPLGFDTPKPPSARVVVITPEKLAARLRSDPSGLLAEFGMFVIDEAHLVADQARGWRIEETLSLLHHLTRDFHHRIIVLSAALGSQVHFYAWLDSGEGVLARHETWRGPRRLSAIYTTRLDFNAAVEEPAVGRRLPRRVIPLTGVVHLRTGTGRRFVEGAFSEPVGELVQRQNRDGEWVTDGDRTTKQNARLVPLIRYINATGPVLVVHSTKRDAQQLAEEIASNLGEDHANFALTDLVKSRLGPDHALTRVVSKGIAFHHSALPVDIQSEIEDAVRIGRIKCLVATTTLTEGVNLPFKSVVIAQRGYPSANGFVEIIDSARLLNAVGRAGRAGRETEGWLILVEQRRFEASQFDPLDQTALDIDMRSTMASQVALGQLAKLEDSLRNQTDSIFSSAGSEADGFVSFIWLVAQALSELNEPSSEEKVLEAIEDTLAWQQLEDEDRRVLIEIASHAYRAYTNQPVEVRKRWAQSGLSLPSAVSLEHVAAEVVAAVSDEIALLQPAQAVALILGDGRLESILNLSENSQRGFKARRNAPRRDSLPIDLMRLLVDWVSGMDLQTLADSHLSAVIDEDYRYQQLSEFTASVFEHYLPWSLGIIITWANDALHANGEDLQIPGDLAAAVHYGVSTRDALRLMVGGVRSRRLANRIGALRVEAGPDVMEEHLRDWLSRQSISSWRARFGASPTEISDLLAFARNPSVQLVNEVLEGREYLLPCVARAEVPVESVADLEREPGQPEPAPFAAFVNSVLVGVVGAEFHDDVELLTSIGIPLDVRVRPSDKGIDLVFRLPLSFV